MEDTYTQLKWNKSTLNSDKTLRLQERPSQAKRGTRFEDLGSDFSRNRVTDKRGGSIASGVTTKKPSLEQFNETESGSSTESSDELDIISAQSKTKGGTQPSSRLLPSAGSIDSTGQNDEGVMVDGDFHHWQSRSELLKTISFKKITEHSDISENNASQSRASSSTSKRPVSVARSTHIGTKAASAPYKPPAIIRDVSHSRTGREPRKVGADQSTPRPKPVRPNPSPAAKLHGEQTIQLPKNEKIPSRPKRGILPVTQTNEGLREGKEKDLHTSDISRVPNQKDKAKISAFPMDSYSPVKGKGKARDFPMSPPQKVGISRTQGSQSSSSPQPSRRAEKQLPASTPTAAFPTLSPLSSPNRRKANAKISRPPSTKEESKRSKAASTSRLKGAGGSEDDTPRIPPSKSKPLRRELQPFPMETQELQGIDGDAWDVFEDIDTSSSEEERGRKRARGGDEILRELMCSDDMSGSEDEIFINRDVDPSTLCPWCDQPLPPAPSPYLQKLMAAARSRSSKDPRLSNPQGLHALATVFVNVCYRHEFERHHLPLAQKRGWPIEIAWDRLAERIAELKLHLQDIVDDVDENFEHDDIEQHGDIVDSDFYLDFRPRKGSLFWMEVVRSVKKRGSNGASGIHAQMSNFSKLQPGYYGELGALIISQTLYDLFPPHKFPPNSTLPLTPAEFIQMILVPEAAVSLIMADMQQTRVEAIATMRESAQYGVAMFPDDNAEDTSAGETIIKKRAEARRKQLEQEGSDDGDEDMDGACGLHSKGRGSTPLSESNVPVSQRRNVGRKATTRNYAESDEDMRMVTDSGTSDAGKSRKLRSKRMVETAKQPTRKIPTTGFASSEAPSSSVPGMSRPRPRPIIKENVDPSSGVESSDCVASSDAEMPSSQLAVHSHRHIKFGSRGRAQVAVLSKDGTWQTEPDATPKPVKHTKSGKKKSVSRSSSIADFGLYIEPSTAKAGSSIGALYKDEWSYNLRGGDDFDEEL